MVREIPGARWSNDHKTWYCPLSWASCVALRGVFGESLGVGPGLNEWAALERRRVDACIQLRDSEDAYPAARDLLWESALLEPRQRACVEFLAVAGRALCADEMGAGKTIEAICAVESLVQAYHADAYPCLVVCTNSMVYEWEREIRKWAPHRSVAVVKGTAAKRRKIIEAGADWLIINWEALAAHTRLASFGNLRLSDKEKQPKELNEHQPRTVVADEAHKAKNPKAKSTRAWWWLSHHAEQSIALTGTPIEHGPEDYWSLLHGVCPEEFPSKTSWIDRYCVQSWNAFGGREVTGIRPDTRAELFAYADARVIRRPKLVVIPNLIEKLEPQIREVDMPTSQRKAYEAMREEMIAELDSGVLVATSALAKMTRLLQFAQATADLIDGEVVLKDPSCKLDALDDLLDEVGGEPLVVFAESRLLIDLAAKRLEKRKVPFGTVVGGQSELDRSDTVASFQRGSIQIVLATIGAGSEGLTLTASCKPVFLQRSLSRRANLQAEDRTHRRGQDKPVQPIIIRAKGTIEEGLALGEAAKEERAEEILRDRDHLLRLLGAANAGGAG